MEVSVKREDYSDSRRVSVRPDATSDWVHLCSVRTQKQVDALVSVLSGLPLVIAYPDSGVAKHVVQETNLLNTVRAVIRRVEKSWQSDATMLPDGKFCTVPSPLFRELARAFAESEAVSSKTEGKENEVGN